MLLMILFSCTVQPADSSSVETPNLQQDFSVYESPCLDGVVYNMRERGCRVEVVNSDSGMNRYYCRYDDEHPGIHDAWTTRSFASWESGESPDAKTLSDLDYYPACSDWSLEIFYR
jgi:hypothetical protein